MAQVSSTAAAIPGYPTPPSDADAFSYLVARADPPPNDGLSTAAPYATDDLQRFGRTAPGGAVMIAPGAGGAPEPGQFLEVPTGDGGVVRASGYFDPATATQSTKVLGIFKPPSTRLDEMAPGVGLKPPSIENWWTVELPLQKTKLGGGRFGAEAGIDAGVGYEPKFDRTGDLVGHQVRIEVKAGAKLDLGQVVGAGLADPRLGIPAGTRTQLLRNLDQGVLANAQSKIPSGAAGKAIVDILVTRANDTSLDGAAAWRTPNVGVHVTFIGEVTGGGVSVAPGGAARQAMGSLPKPMQKLAETSDKVEMKAGVAVQYVSPQRIPASAAAASAPAAQQTDAAPMDAQRIARAAYDRYVRDGHAPADARAWVTDAYRNGGKAALVARATPDVPGSVHTAVFRANGMGAQAAGLANEAYLALRQFGSSPAQAWSTVWTSYLQGLGSGGNAGAVNRLSELSARI